MIIGILKEVQKGEKRVSMTPTIVKLLIKRGFDCYVENDAGLAAKFKDSHYEKSGASIKSRDEIFKEADILVKINPFNKDEIKLLREGQVLISKLYHLSSPKLIEALSEKGVSAFSMDAMPRISRAQDMDVLSSQNNLAGYKAVILGAYEMSKIFPLMMTAAGTITPSRVLIFGVGVAGLQAIATAKRLGAIVEATDIRSETKEQVESLGAKFISVDNEGEKSEGGYAKEASDEYKQRQKEAVEKSLFNADLVITTALIPGRKAPILITEEQVHKMKTGAVIIDLAAGQGGNCESSKLNKILRVNGVKVIGTIMSPESVSTNASELFAKNIYNFVAHLTDENGFKWDLEEEITDGTLIVHKGINRKQINKIAYESNN
ncbi:MAG: Re/Si-specific NAD(P)(+) transhydrogenase subunit alpha [Flavobacteriaceae bacterium]|nr:Re/Si-specific NAD(P)(+) transhydrogenase subunit alpha [Flavobacteriaceae bacterium]